MNDSNAIECELAAEVIRNFGEIRIRVGGTSMAPALQPGDLIVVRQEPIVEISAGEVVLFERMGRLFAHRVVEKSSGSSELVLVTRGDRLKNNDAPVSAAELLGRVALVERGPRRFQPASRPGRTQLLLGQILRLSDHATFFYLRLASLSRRWRVEGAACQQ